jgi:hypothetical protein
MCPKTIDGLFLLPLDISFVFITWFLLWDFGYQDMPRPFKKLKDLDLDETAANIIAKLT